MSKGKDYEELAARHLLEAGLKLLEKNYRCKAGEIDLICSQGEQLVFVEVRYRGNSRFASASESVDRRKQRKIIRTAQLYLQRNRQFQQSPCRFDVIAISPSQYSADVNIQWLQSAFIS